MYIIQRRKLKDFIFEQHGFQNKIQVPELGLKLELGSDQYFRNDGIVKDLAEHLTEIEEKLRVERTREIPQSTKGLHVSPPDSCECKYSIIFVKDTNDPLEDLVTLGHEVTHALIYLDLEEYIVGLLEECGFDSRKYLRIKDEEIKADIGGCLFAYAKESDNSLPSLIDFMMNHPDFVRRQ